jgi:hypothetical protein
MALSSIAIKQTKGTTSTIEKAKQLLDYLATNPDATMRFTEPHGGVIGGPVQEFPPFIFGRKPESSELSEVEYIWTDNQQRERPVYLEECSEGSPHRINVSVCPSVHLSVLNTKTRRFST